MPFSVTLGLAGAPLWTAKCKYVTTSAFRYAGMVGETQENIITLFFGIFFVARLASGLKGFSSAGIIRDGCVRTQGLYTTNYYQVPITAAENAFRPAECPAYYARPNDNLDRIQVRVSLLVLLGAVAVRIYWNYDGFDPESVRGATVVITGCSTGIGEEMAYQYARLGAKILITARRENRLKEVVAKAKSLGAQEAHYVAGDMGKAEDCERTIQTAKEKFGQLDYLVLNHVGSRFKSTEDVFIDMRKGKSWDQDPDVDFLVDFLNISLVSYVRLASLALPLLKESSGHIVVIGSIAGKIDKEERRIHPVLYFG
ncbi:HSD11B1L [Branchiostoma lanceolatum]|uniref:HSD11B1L protein n=1 Tax=Branchiostoma lanceolatum TaxID=7740 RepID=A0A8J9ZVE3_BRALA|nr:HSD11B1L [Branchiostoma lanceolatum]